MNCVWVIFQKISRLITWKRLGSMDMHTIFSVDFDNISISNITDIPKYLMKKRNIL